MLTKIVETTNGPICGVVEDGCCVFKGVPYARPPIGELRFHAPLRPAYSDELFIADTYGNRIAQLPWKSPDGFYEREFYGDTIYKTPISEDGLYLNLWISMQPQEKPMPVLFFIHGGGFLGGTGHEIEFRSSAYAQRGIILVTINYRVGIFGFLAHSWLIQEDPIACGNYGILDQIAALEWVKENIAAFGGDPAHITICGQSAGGVSVLTLLGSRLADGKYAGAIIQSGGGYPQLLTEGKSLEEALSMGQFAMDAVRITSLDALRQVGIDVLLLAQEAVMRESQKAGDPLFYCPVINGCVITAALNELTRTGRLSNVPVIIGSTKNDVTVTEDEALNDNSRLHQSCVDFSLIRQNHSPSPFYVYYFKRQLPGDSAGAFHSGELWYTFGTLSQCWRPMRPEDYALSEQMLDYWGNFIKTGDPNNEGLKPWPPCLKNDPYVKTFDVY